MVHVPPDAISSPNKPSLPSSSCHMSSKYPDRVSFVPQSHEITGTEARILELLHSRPPKKPTRDFHSVCIGTVLRSGYH